jgi:hypothetical protein
VVLISSERNPVYVAGYAWKLRVHLLPFFGDKVLSEITPGLVQHRVRRDRKEGSTPSIPEAAIAGARKKRTTLELS